MVRDRKQQTDFPSLIEPYSAIDLYSLLALSWAPAEAARPWIRG